LRYAPIIVLVLVLLAVLLVLTPSVSWAKDTEEVSSAFLHVRRAAVASDSAAASAAGVWALEHGGNAVDAACATALALGVVDPFASGLGGGGFALVYLAKARKVVALDFRETAPAALSGEDGAKPIAPQSGRSVGVPGEPRGLTELVRRFGRLPFSRCTRPALRLAQGFAASAWLARQIQDEMERHPSSAPALMARLFAVKDGSPGKIRAGDRVARPSLARTLSRLARLGADAFYRGDIAKEIVEATRAAGGVLTTEDLAGYATVERTPLETKLVGRRIVTMPPPSAGGVILVEALGVLSHRIATRPPDWQPQSPAYLHVVTEALKHGFADRARYLGDPDFVTLPLDHLLDPAYHDELSARIRPDQVLDHDAYGTKSALPAQGARDGGTAHISVVDQEGNAVALTTTINLEFGSRIVAGDTGIVLNDELDDFTLAAGRADVFSLAGATANLAAAGKRPVSSMTPTLVLGDRGVELVTGAAGGPRIVSATLQIVLDVLVFGLTAQQAIATPRFHHQWEPDFLFYEPGLPPDAVLAVEKTGQKTMLRLDIGKANVIVRTPDGFDAAADPRSGGAALGF
jgi:gamma-glutamyltranspeptidase/glutathione hydrolase